MSSAHASERVVAIIGSTMLDLAVRRILAAYMVDEGGVAANLLGAEGSSGQAPLGTFSSRISACYALGLIATDERDALNIVRRIRNSFAHRLSDKISEQSLTDLTANLCELVMPIEARKRLGRKPRQVFVKSCITGLAFTLAGRIKQVGQQRRHVYNGGKISFWTAKHTAPIPPFD